MNKYISTTFDTVKQEEASYRQSVESALYDYRRTMSKVKEQAKQYKDEDAFINSQKDAAKREAQDIKATATAPEIERDGQAEVEVARQRAHDRAEADAQVAQNLEKYKL